MNTKMKTEKKNSLKYENAVKLLKKYGIPAVQILKVVDNFAKVFDDNWKKEVAHWIWDLISNLMN